MFRIRFDWVIRPKWHYFLLKSKNARPARNTRNAHGVIRGSEGGHGTWAGVFPGTLRWAVRQPEQNVWECWDSSPAHLYTPFTCSLAEGCPSIAACPFGTVTCVPISLLMAQDGHGKSILPHLLSKGKNIWLMPGHLENQRPLALRLVPSEQLT